MSTSTLLRQQGSHSVWSMLQDGVRQLPGVSPEPTKPSDQPDDAQNFRESGAWSMIGLYAIMVFFAIRGNGFERVWTIMGGFFTTDLTQLRSVGDNLTNLLPTVAALLVIQIPLMAGLGLLMYALYGNAKSHSVIKAFSGIKRHYMVMTLTVVIEELVARGLFLALPIWLSGGRLPVWAIYLLFLVGNGLWAAVHLANYKDKRERHLLVILPQFVAGFFLTAIYLNFGLVGAIVAHLAFNFLLMSMYRKGKFNWDEIAVIIWRSLLCAASLMILWLVYGKSLLELSYWFYGESFAVPGWQWQHYLLAVLAITSILTILGDLLLLDVLPEPVNMQQQIGYLFTVISISFGVFIVLNLLAVPHDTQVLGMALAYLLVRRSGSASGMARVFWIGLPNMMCLLCASLALGPESYFWLIVLAVALTELPDGYFRHQNATNDGYDLTKLK